MTTYRVTIGGLLDVVEDNDGQNFLPFLPVDYGEDNDIPRQCMECNQTLPQGQMKELSLGSGFGSGTSLCKIYADGVFVCRECWFGGIGNLKRWVG